MPRRRKRNWKNQLLVDLNEELATVGMRALVQYSGKYFHVLKGVDHMCMLTYHKDSDSWTATWNMAAVGKGFLKHPSALEAVNHYRNR